MTSEAVARRTLTQVEAASWIVRFIFIVDIVSGVLTIVFRGVDWWGTALLCNGFVALVHPLLLSCLYSQKPAISNKPCRIYGRFVLYFWLFVLNCALTPLFIFGFGYMAAFYSYTFDYDQPAVTILLYVVGLVSCLMLTVVNLYTFCILHKYGCCFVYRLRQDVEEAAATTNSGMVATASVYINSTVPEARSPCNPPPYSVSVQPEVHVQTFAAEKQFGNNF
ncbi:uncharacterized protein LOC127880329 isoform X2 [Dreissena polymorpha]|uniref:Uncharacterized protein n=1 Tax=Dreissena polymorpha TaxID=45954 RepID=A0A9D4H870_DREPO|nr:uncharacterized protein LOC127880329 isoform X1 [Dreissena polymorpha]XP_052283699.1 uncharacterized protein LOC127880329 isoform X2 [Dreissena polymorpha]KAH3831399.1 hypothetical protein DPMN_104666 [Dreissena polymorpha]